MKRSVGTLPCRIIGTVVNMEGYVIPTSVNKQIRGRTVNADREYYWSREIHFYKSSALYSEKICFSSWAFGKNDPVYRSGKL